MTSTPRKTVNRCNKWEKSLRTADKSSVQGIWKQALFSWSGAKWEIEFVMQDEKKVDWERNKDC